MSYDKQEEEQGGHHKVVDHRRCPPVYSSLILSVPAVDS